MKAHHSVIKKFPALVVTLASSFYASAAYADTCEPYDPTAEYQLVFADEFEGTELDRVRWNTEYLWGPGVIINNEEQYYVNADQFGYNPFEVSDGVLSINGIDYAYEIIARDENGNALSTEQITVNTSERGSSSPRTAFSLELDTKIYSNTSGELVWRSPNRAAYYEVTHDGNTQRFNGRTFSSLYLDNIPANQDLSYTVAAYDLCDELIIEDSIILNTADGQSANEVSERLVIAASTYSESTVEISWNAVQGASEYTIYDNGQLFDTISGRSMFVDNMVPGVDRKFLVVAIDSDGVEVDRTSRTLNTADSSFALNRQPFVSGIITSYDSFRFKYGKVEMRARMPAGKGLWSAFWLLNAYYHDAQPEDPEIDIIEAIGDQTTTANHAYHTQRDSDGNGVTDTVDSDEFRATIPDFSTDFHRYSVEWTPDAITYMVNDVVTGEVRGERVSQEQMYIILNLAVGGFFPGSPDETTPFPASFDIDYVRVYQKRR